jgi:FkbM family methyltransferase
MEKDELLKNDPLKIVDVGASGGIDPRWGKLTSFYRAVLFEPDTRQYEILRSESGKNLTVLNAALSSEKSDMINLNLCKKQQVSSVYTPNIDILDKFKDSQRFEVINTVTVATDTLNNQLRKNNVIEIDFMKIDVQGHELAILKGSSEYLDNLIGMEIEVEFLQVYKNQPLFCDIDAFVRKNGFELFDIRRYYWKRKESVHVGNQKGQLVFGDALYFRSPEQVLSIQNITQEKIAKAVYVYLAYGYMDLAQALVNGAAETKKLDKKFLKTIRKTVAKYRKKSIPEFRGRRKLQRLFERIASMLSSGGSDRFLGNP